MKTKLAFLFPALLALTLAPAGATIRYVNLTNASPAPPYNDWARAATNIQDAVEAALAGDEVVVTDGVYQTGGRVVDGAMTNRLVVDKMVTVRSVNGPAHTTIEGHQLPESSNGDGAIRCVYLINGAVLSGFTLTRGATRLFGSDEREQSGGGVYCASVDGIVTNCILTGNTARYGGGANGCTLNNCTLTENSGRGGGVSFGVLNNCKIAHNRTGEVGGGAAYSTLNNCTLSGNSAREGGGAAYCTLNNCIAYYNTATDHSPDYLNNIPGMVNYSCLGSLPFEGLENFTNAPVFVDEAGGNLRLASNSPCINAGNNSYAPGSTDLDGGPRIVSGAVDVGAYEFQDETPLFRGPVTVNEGNAGTTNAVFIVSLATIHSEVVSIDFATADGSASAGSDYVATNGTLVFIPGETNKIIEVPVLSDILDETNETFFVRLANPTNISLAMTQATGIILDDDTVPLSITGAALLEGNTGTTDATFVLQLDRPHILAVSVDFATADGSAAAGADYVATNGTLTFAPGETNKSITVLVKGDLADETNETFFVNLSHPVHAALTRDHVQETILDDDTALTITQQPASQTVRPGSHVTFRVSSASTFPPITHQWRFNGTDILDATNSTLTLNNVQFVNAGDYSVLVTDSLSFALSETATLTVVESVDYFTRRFDPFDNAPVFSSLTFTPDGSANFYATCREGATSFPTDPTGGTVLPLSDDSYVQITLTGTSTVAIYDRRTNVLFIGSNGYLTMDRGDDGLDGSLSHHFDRPRISAMFDDLLPEAGGTVSWKQLNNLMAVTYQNVRHYDYGGANSFQIEMFFDGRIRLTYLALVTHGGLAGLSSGNGVPADFLESDLSSYDVCRKDSLSISGATVPEGNAWVTNALFTVSLATNHAELVSVDFTTADGNATAGSDYLPVSGTLIFNAGETIKTITVPVLGDVLDEANEIFFVRLSNPTNISLANTQAVGTIIDDDTIVTITEQPTNQLVRPGSNGTFRVSAITTFPPISYRWRFNGVRIPEATSPVLTISNVNLSHDGTYDVVVTDAIGFAMSNPARLSVLFNPVIVEPPLSQTVVEGSEFTMSVKVTGNPVPFAYSWRRGATVIATNSGNYRSNFVTLNTSAAGLILTNNMLSSNYTMRLVVYNAANSSPGVLVTFTNTVLADFDRDGIPDEFEQTIGLDPHNAADAALDSDGDGMSNLAEYISGTNPTNAASYLRVEQGITKGEATVWVAAMPNRTYSVQFTDNLSSGVWRRLADIVARSTNRVELFADPAWGTNRFYRVTVPRQP